MPDLSSSLPSSRETPSEPFGRPSFRPEALALARPSRVRSEIRSRSTSANSAKSVVMTCYGMTPCQHSCVRQHLWPLSAGRRRPSAQEWAAETTNDRRSLRRRVTLLFGDLGYPFNRSPVRRARSRPVPAGARGFRVGELAVAHESGALPGPHRQPSTSESPANAAAGAWVPAELGAASGEPPVDNHGVEQLRLHGYPRQGAFPISRSRAHTHRRHGHPLQTVPSAGLIERPQEKNRVDALR